MRLFVAFDIPDEVRSTLGLVIEKLRPTCRDSRWVRIEGVHITLKFIGEVPLEKQEAINTALATVNFPLPIKILFRGFGFFPKERRQRVLWVGIEADDSLGTLANAVETALELRGVAREPRAFSPHLTLARFDSPGDLKSLHAGIAEIKVREFGCATLKEFHLYQSVLKTGGAEYTRLATFRFSGGETQ